MKSILKIFNWPSKDVDRAKQRWGILRISLSDALKKPARQNWRYMKQMEFLIPHLGQTRKRKYLDTVDLTAENENHYVANNSIDQNDNSESKDAQKEKEDEYLKFSAETENNFKNRNLPKDHALYKFFIAMYKVVQKLPDSKRLNLKMNIFDIVRSTRDLVRENETIKRSIIESKNLQVQKSKKMYLSPTTSSSSTNTTSVLSNPTIKQSKNKGALRSELNGISYVPIASTSTSKNTFVLRNRAHDDLGTNKQDDIGFLLPKATTIETKYSKQFETEQTKSERSDLNTTFSSPNTDLIISNVAHIEHSMYEELGSKRIDANPNQVSKTLQNTKENVKKELNLVHDENATPGPKSSINCDKTLTQIKVENQNNDEHLSLSEASFSDVEVISVEDIKIEISDGE